VVLCRGCGGQQPECDDSRKLASGGLLGGHETDRKIVGRPNIDRRRAGSAARGFREASAMSNRPRRERNGTSSTGARGIRSTAGDNSVDMASPTKGWTQYELLTLRYAAECSSGRPSCGRLCAGKGEVIKAMWSRAADLDTVPPTVTFPAFPEHRCLLAFKDLHTTFFIKKRLLLVLPKNILCCL